MSAPPLPGMTRARGPMRRARRVLEVYGGLLRAELQAAAGYRAQLVLQLFAWTVPFAFLALWRGAAGGGAVEGITGAQFTTYYAVLLLTTSVQVSRPLAFGLSPLVHSGQLSAMLLQPRHPLHVIIARAVAGQLYVIPPLVVVIPLVIGWGGGSVVTDAGRLIVAGALCLLGTVAVGYLAAMMGSIALWMTNSAGIRGLLVGAEWILGGLVAPIVLLPGVLPAVLAHQPMWFAVGAPAEIVSGIADPGWWAVVEAVAWVVLLDRVFRVVWSRGVRRYEAVGS